MTREQLKHYRDSLRAMANRLGGTIAGLEDQVRTPTGGESAGGISNAPLHLADTGSEVYNQELGATLLENETYIRDEVAAALDRIDRGTYGRCERCGKDVIPERLEALPYTRFCTPCAAETRAGAEVNFNRGRPDSWLGVPGHEALDLTGSPDRVVGRDLGGGPGDVHAVGTPGGGTVVGGLAGTNVGDGSPDGAHLEQAMGSGDYDARTAPADADDPEDEEDEPEAFAGPSGGAVGGTPANKRARGGRAPVPHEPKTTRPAAPKPAPKSGPKSVPKSAPKSGPKSGAKKGDAGRGEARKSKKGGGRKS